ncbi:DUF724 domain-containing protein 3-like isoform X2 [Prunus avium]|uniref:DUF724 domain-containing protein 3-like isoform X2 n=1 Tax=Prunus avium TaxID=42229 RepID=A0A6P5TMU4_PRUAV|nr:DUF724 domain-containing protein 3-like isoform X2 [Prunus avium]
MVVKRSQAHLSKDSKVEVCSNEDGYKGAWFPAIILDPQPSDGTPKKKRKSLGNSSKALVQYETLVSEDDPNKPLTELVDVCSIRPVPPPDNPDQPFEPANVVDAFYQEAWWVGVVMRFEDDKYTVGFKNPPDLLELRRSELRPHWDLLDGVWVRARKERMAGSFFSPGTAVEVNLYKEHPFCAWFPAIYLGELGANYFLLQYKSSNNCDVKVVVGGKQIRPQPPKLAERDFNLMEKVDAFFDMGWWVGEIIKVLTGKKYLVCLKLTEEVKQRSQSELRRHMYWTDGRWVTIINGKRVTMINRNWVTMINGNWVPYFKEGHFSRDYEVRSKRACRSSRSSELAVALECSGATKDNNEEKTPCLRISWKNQSEDLSPCIDKSPYGKTKKKLKINQKPNDDATILGLSKKLIWGHSEDSLSFAQLFRRSEEAPVRDGVKTKQQQVGGLDNQAIVSLKRKVKKGREIKKADEEDVDDEYGVDNIESFGTESKLTRGSHADTSCLLPMEEFEWNEDGVSSELHVIKRLDWTGEKQNGTGVVAQVELTKTQVANVNGNPTGISNKQNEVGGRQVETGVTADTEQQDNPLCLSEKFSGWEKNCNHGCSEEAMRETETVDSAMDYLTKEVQVTVTGVSATASAYDQPLSLYIDEMHSIKAKECSSNSAGTAKQQNEVGGAQVEQQDSTHSPFVRSSPFWKSIESMEVFKRFPQRPHFHPLVKCKAVCREGSALGNMITFASLVEKTSKLQVGDPRDLIDSNLEALVDLEILGFDVMAVRHRLKELIEMKVKLGQLENQSKEVDIQITECTFDRTRNSETISLIDKEIKDLKEKRGTLMSIDVAKGSEISKLQSEANAITEGIQSIHRDFEKLAAAAW